MNVMGKDVKVVSIEEINEERLYFEYNHDRSLEILKQLEPQLTPREKVVLKLILDGKKLKDIAKVLKISKPRVTAIKKQILKKLKFRC